MILLKILLLSYTITAFEPLEWLLQALTERFNNSLTNTIALLLTCPKCCSLWIGLLMTGNIWIAMLASLIMAILDKTFIKWLKKITF